MQAPRKPALSYRIIKGLVRLFYPRITVTGLEHLPADASIVVANHAQMNGPIACELYFPGRRYTWCAGQMMHRKEVPAYAYQDFWSHKPKCIRWFYKLLSHLIAPLSVCIFTNADTIAVYRDTRILSTFRDTVTRLAEGAHVVVFPEHDQPHNHILCDFQEKFIDIARIYHKKTGRELAFVPMYIAPDLKRMQLGEPVRFHADAPIREERTRICTALMDRITDIARSLPEHTVVPYRNIPRKHYPSNHTDKVTAHEKTRG